VSAARLQVAVPAELLGLPPTGGHGKVWHRVLGELRRSVELIEIPARGTSRRRRDWLRPGAASKADVVLASGHDELPASDAPLVVQVHEAGWFDPELRARINSEFLAHIESRTEAAVGAAAAVITPSQAARQGLLESYGIPADRVHAIHHGVDPCFHPEAGASRGRAAVARALGGRDERYVLYAATLHPRKNLDALRAAFVQLAAAGFPHVLAIAGQPAPDRPDSSDLERAAAAEIQGAPGRAVRLGAPPDEELAALMAGADAFCLPSLYEGFGLTALEAMACGAPVIVSDRGALPEVVDGGGIVVEPSPEAIAAALERVLSDDELASSLRRRAVERARAFTWARTASGWLAVLRAAAARP
jgi:glycosyltransferase involved in cell wall biosynthesis